ncbi:hypothetical protein Vadar_006014 [Vaccinium darrowii]|uniref:Uncharacterized protein n=1 Tax=Vaccinium darrowii TaxID=229202 RepID=A0ACB7X808_9ERIC|nr:hypothetical protein Vadar_006014 [Vaccinium darrowii]
MPERKRYRTPYSESPDVEKRAIDERSKILAAEKIGKRPQLFPVPIHELPNTTSSVSATIKGPAKIGTSTNLSADLDENLCMAPTYMDFSDIKPGINYYKTSGMVIEKALPHTLGKTTTMFQRIVLQNSKLTLTAKTPIEEVQIDGLTMRSLKYNFTQLSDLEHVAESGPKIDVLFAILEVGPRRKPKNSWVADVKVIDQSLRPTTISLWDQFSEIEAHEMANLPGTFPIAIGLHLRIASYYGIGLGTHNSTIFIFNPPTPQAAALQTWCLENAAKIKALPLTGADKTPNIALTMPQPDEIVNIIDLPTSVDKPEMRSVKAVIRVADLNQRFYYLTCSLCKATTASRDEEFFCNYCNEKVTALPKIKFQAKLTDLTDSIDAMVFAAVSEQYYGITGKDVDTSAMDGSHPLSLLKKLSEPRDCTIRLRAEMNDYGGLNQCKFIIQAIFDSAQIKQSATLKHTLRLDPATPPKKAKGENYTAQTSATDSSNKTSDSNTEMDTEGNPQTKPKND